MNNYNNRITGIILLIMVVILISSCAKIPVATSGYNWEDKDEGVWTKTDLECMEKNILRYTCVSNCYENKEVQLPYMEGTYNVWNLGYDLSESFIEKTKTNTDIEVICFDQGCAPTKDDQGIWTAVCPAG